MLLAALAAIAIVTQDQTPLRAAPRDSAQQQELLWQGDVLEIRGQKLNYLQVYDHRNERAGYIRATQVRTSSLQAQAAPELLAVVRFLRDTAGAETLGIAYSAAYIKAAPAEAIEPEIFDALGSMAERLARQASSRQAKASDIALAAHLDVAASYGVTMQSFERDGRIQRCYDGDAFRHVLAMTNPTAFIKTLADEKAADQRARAALALTRHECIDPGIGPTAKYALDNWRAQILDNIDLSNLPDYLKNRVHIRRAGVWASLAYERARRNENAAEAANRSLQEYAAVNKLELPDEDNYAYNDAGVRVGASRFANEQLFSENPVSEKMLSLKTKMAMTTVAGQPGETCLLLTDAKHDQSAPLLKRCTYGVVWISSARFNAQGTVATLAVQPLESWRELWVLQRKNNQWEVDVLPPSTSGPDIGYLEFAGWVPGTEKILAARETKIDGRFQRSFEVIALDSLQTQKQASKPEFLSLFYRWQDPQWKRQTVSVR